MKYLIYKLLMRLSGSYAPKEPAKVDIELMEDWLKSLAGDKSGYRHYYTTRKKHILEGMVSGMKQEDYWINHGRILELQQINANSVKLIKKSNKK